MIDSMPTQLLDVEWRFSDRHPAEPDTAQTVRELGVAAFARRGVAVTAQGTFLVDAVGRRYSVTRRVTSGSMDGQRHYACRAVPLCYCTGLGPCACDGLPLRGMGMIQAGQLGYRPVDGRWECPRCCDRWPLGEIPYTHRYADGGGTCTGTPSVNNP